MTELELCDRDANHGLASHRLTFTSGGTMCQLVFCQTCVDQMTAKPLVDLSATVTIEPIRSDDDG